MQVADGMYRVNEEDLQFSRQIGVTHLVTRPAATPERGYYDYASLIQLRTQVESAGLQVTAIHDVLPEWNDQIRRGLPGREEQLDNYCRTVENIGRAGIPILGYSFHAYQVWRTTRHAPDRGGATFTGYDHALMRDAPPLAQPPIGDEQMWDNYTYFLKRVLPVAESAGVKLALHPDDPPISPIAGAACIFRSVEAFQRVLDMAPSPSNGLLFCQGCYTEMLGPGVYDAIRHFAAQGKVFYVHFRNVAGQLPVFREAFLDTGDIDMFKAMQVWKESGYDGPMMPDHYGHIVGDTDYGHRAHAHAIGYMQALMAAAGAL